MNNPAVETRIAAGEWQLDCFPAVQLLSIAARSDAQVFHDTISRFINWPYSYPLRGNRHKTH